VEIKTLLATHERSDGLRANARTVHNRLMAATRQAAVVIVSTEGSGCRPADAAAGLRSFAAAGRTGQVTAVRIVGDGFDLSWLGPNHRDTTIRAETTRTHPPVASGDGVRPDRSSVAPDAPPDRPSVARPAVRRADGVSVPQSHEPRPSGPRPREPQRLPPRPREPRPRQRPAGRELPSI
jgi:hypothetical protein